jgi:hypothetical protein
MSFEILIESWEAEERVEKMLNKLQVVPVPAELTAWQTEDMHRKIPNTETINPTAALTMIYPRSRTQLVAKKGAPIRRSTWNKPRVVQRYRTGGIQHVSTRPILRPELFQKLCERMSRMLSRELKW